MDPNSSVIKRLWCITFGLKKAPFLKLCAKMHRLVLAFADGICNKVYYMHNQEIP